LLNNIDELLIDISSMPDDEDKHGQDIVFDLVDDTIVTDAYAVTRPPFEFFIAVRPGIGRQVF